MILPSVVSLAHSSSLVSVVSVEVLLPLIN